MSAWKKLLAAPAGADGLDVDDVFSTYLYAGDGTNGRQINNGIDLSGEGGMVWFKARTTAQNHRLFDTVRGSDYSLIPNAASAQSDHGSGGLNSFDDDGFTLGNAVVNGSGIYGGDYASWTWRKAPKFFDVVTYSGNGANRSISHSLGSEPGMIIIKRTDASESWQVYHRGLHQGGGSGLTAYWASIELESTGGQYGGQRKWGAGTGEDHTDSTFYVSNLGSINENNGTFVAYLFAHNDGDGEFGPDSDQDIIKCGSYTGSSSDQLIDLGFEPQWLMVKSSSFSQDWVLFDTMRGLTNLNSERLVANDSSAGANSTGFPIPISADGFSIDASKVSSALNSNGQTYIYMAIRRGPLAPPEAGTEVFATDHRGSSAATAAGTSYYSGFPVDMTFGRNRTYAGGNTSVYDRLRGDKNLFTDLTNAEGTASYYLDSNTGFWGSTQSENTAQSAWMWKRAPSFFDVGAYSGTGANRTISHNLGVAPEMVWFKSRSSTVDWIVYHKDLGGSYPSSRNYLYLNQSSGVVTPYQPFTSAPTASTMALSASSGTNSSGVNYIAYLFATLAGVSKVGSVTHSGTTNVDCGFSAGARFVLLKRTNATGDWYIWDSVRGIIAGNDPYLLLNSTAAEVTNTDYIDPLSSGFTITSSFTAGDYIFYAIA